MHLYHRGPLSEKGTSRQPPASGKLNNGTYQLAMRASCSPFIVIKPSVLVLSNDLNEAKKASSEAFDGGRAVTRIGPHPDNNAPASVRYSKNGRIDMSGMGFLSTGQAWNLASRPLAFPIIFRGIDIEVLFIGVSISVGIFGLSNLIQYRPNRHPLPAQGLAQGPRAWRRPSQRAPRGRRQTGQNRHQPSRLPRRYAISGAGNDQGTMPRLRGGIPAIRQANQDQN
jgi:hypothetical protein